MAGNLNTFIQRMIWWARYGNLGYDQYQRWNFYVGGEVDCSSFVISVLKEAGFDTGGATYTGNMSAALVARGWQRIFPNGKPQAGDILLNDVHHVAVCVAPGQLAQASIDERGRASGGRSGDQGRETNVRSYYAYPWNAYLRYVGGSGGGSTPAPAPGKARTKTDGQLMLDIDGDPQGATYSRFQQVMGTPIDGVKSRPSEMIRAFQRWLNTVVSRKDIKVITGYDQLDTDGVDGWRTWKTFQYWAANVRRDLIRLYAPGWGIWDFADGDPGIRTWKVLQHILNESYANSGKLLKK